MIKKNNFCNFVDIGLDQYQCSYCGLIISSYDGPPALVCSYIEENFLKEIEDSELLCSKEQIVKRHNICSMCDFFKNNSCEKCGCRVVRNLEFTNKLLWKDQECPIGKWSKEI